MYTANDVMTKALVTLPSTATLEKAILTLLACRISGVPIVDDQDNLVGIISEFQLLAVIFDEEFKCKPVSELMTKDVITVTDTTPLSEVAKLFISHQIRRLPVLRQKRLVGQISRRDIIRYAVDDKDGFKRFMAMYNGHLPSEP